MTVYSPSFDPTLGTFSAGQAIRDEIQRTRESVRGLVSFVLAHHLTPTTLRAFWRNDPRATLKIGALGKAINMDLASVVREVGDLLAGGEGQSLAAFQAQGGRALFEAIDGIAPCVLPAHDERLTAERYHYAADARAALLQHALTTLHARYRPTTSFQSLHEATLWTQSYVAMLRGAEEVIESTRQLLYFEGQAIQAHFATLQRTLEGLEERANSAHTLLHNDWRTMLEQAEEQIIAHLLHRTEKLGDLTMAELNRARGSGWLDGLTRHAPRLSALLMTVAGGSALLHPASRAEIGELTARIPALSAPRAAEDGGGEISRFFASPKAAGLYTLRLADQGALQQLVEAMVGHGYARHETLALFNLASVSEMSAPLTIEIRWSAAGEPLLLPPSAVAAPAEVAAPAPIAQPTVPTSVKVTAMAPLAFSAQPTREGESLEQFAGRVGLPVETLRADNPTLGEALAAGQLVLVRSAVSGGANSAAVTGGGSWGQAPPAVAAPVAPGPVAGVDAGAAMAARYGSEMYPSMEAMPDDLRLYFATTVQDVADFFNVRPGDIIGILAAENNNAGLRIDQPSVSTAGARGVAQVIERTWNGWSNPQRETHLLNMAEIEAHGGLGFDWSARERWQQYQAGQLPLSALADTNATPDRFDNSVAAIARHLVNWELTRDRAASDPAWFERQLGDAISVYNSGRPLAEAEEWVQSAANRKTVGQYVRDAIALSATFPLNLLAAPEAAAAPVPSVAGNEPLRAEFKALMDRTFGVSLSDDELTRLMTGPDVEQAIAGAGSVERAAEGLLQRSMRHYRSAAQAAQTEGRALPWPFITDDATQYGQQLAVVYLGRTLGANELQALVRESGGEPERMAATLAARSDARLYAAARHRYDSLLQRSARGKPVRTSEVSQLLNGALAGHNPRTMDERALQQAMAQIEGTIKRSAEYKSLQGATAFAAMPLNPMPSLIRAFGAPVNYQAGGVHTGIDVANPRVNGQEPELFAVADGTVAYVGPLYCAAANACRGGKAIVLDHGGNVYSIYSHNSVATVKAGDAVTAGQSIGRQGNEGYSFGSHLHLEVHTGAPFSGDWERPFEGGQFEDPMAWLP